MWFDRLSELVSITVAVLLEQYPVCTYSTIVAFTYFRQSRVSMVGLVTRDAFSTHSESQAFCPRFTSASNCQVGCGNVNRTRAITYDWRFECCDCWVNFLDPTLTDPIYRYSTNITSGPVAVVRPEEVVLNPL